jgi:hypothetical protein
MLWLALARPCDSARTFLKSFVFCCSAEKWHKHKAATSKARIWGRDDQFVQFRRKCILHLPLGCRRWKLRDSFKNPRHARAPEGMQGEGPTRRLLSESSPKIKQRLARVRFYIEEFPQLCLPAWTWSHLHHHLRILHTYVISIMCAYHLTRIGMRFTSSLFSGST